MIRRVRIEALAPTGEGVARTPEGVGFVAGALPGEEAEAEVVETRKRFWKGRAVSLLSLSPERRSGGHAEGCAVCDWAHLDPEAARRAKRVLFLQTMERIGGLPREIFGDLPIAPSPLGYRLRARFHVSGSGETAKVGYFAPRSHRVEPADRCEALGEATRALLPRLRDAVGASGARICEIAVVETPGGDARLARATLAPGAERRDASLLLPALEGLFEGISIVERGGATVGRSGEPRLWLEVEGRAFAVAAATFFQSNRHLLADLYRDVAREAAVSAGRALDAFAGAGLFAGALLDAGHSVTSVEGSHAAVELAQAAKKRWNARNWTISRSAVLPFLAGRRQQFDLAVVDPPRAGLGLPLARALPARVSGRLVYVSCEPATLARDLACLRASGLEVIAARLYDLFALTHRVEAVVTLERARSR